LGEPQSPLAPQNLC